MPPDDGTAHLSPESLLTEIRSGADISFDDLLAVIDRFFLFTPTAFDNGTGDRRICNSHDQNQGSCRIFAFGLVHGLDQQETLACFGEHFRAVVADPDGDDHPNIRCFMESGWSGVHIHGTPLTPRPGDGNA